MPDSKKQEFEKYLAGARKWKVLAGVFETVSLEYLLRCLAECDIVKNASKNAGKALRIEFNRIARKYEEFSSSVSASFKQKSQFWSIIVGVGLAFVANIDGLRIFQVYRSDPKLVAAVIDKQDEFFQHSQEIQNAVQELNSLYERYDKTERELAEAIRKNTTNVEALKNKKLELEKAIAGQTDIAEIQKVIHSSREQIANLVSLGVPIGWDFYPVCPYGKTELEWAVGDAQCQSIPVTARVFNESEYRFHVTQTIAEDTPGFIGWFLRVIITGILIGLGAPFWFDVAKRLAQFRKGHQSVSASSEYRFSARNANGDPKKRSEIVRTVLSEVQETAKSKNAVDQNS